MKNSQAVYQLESPLRIISLPSSYVLVVQSKPTGNGWLLYGVDTIGPSTCLESQSIPDREIIGVDISETQIACAPRNIPNCEFKVACAHNLQFITSATADLFCSGQSFHWLPQEETFAEADRALKPGGTIAIFGYDLSTADVPEVQACIQKIWMKLIPVYPRDCIQALHNLHTRNLPYPDQTRTDELKLSRRCTVQQYVDFMKSTWPIRAHKLAHPGEDMLGDIASLLTEALEKSEAAKLLGRQAAYAALSLRFEVAVKQLQVSMVQGFIHRGTRGSSRTKGEK
ncbi:hypothetical protein RRG08_017692 [Elysia crispata]|uniref:Methyltransferase type 11 domain-containing protein n=1 Tax=Elysia crispata TaxID=231223 RepID=A0AAE0Z4D3_9GAST|nr:hypothetical protein RRG08_017692 [Elysia crispata]